MADIGFKLDHAVRRVGDYWEIDGLPTLSLALLYLVCASMILWLPHYHSWRKDLAISGFTLSILETYFYLVARKNSPVIRWLKVRITYPRTGYVALPPSGSPAAARLKELDMRRHPAVWVFLPTVFSDQVDTPWFGAVLAIVATSIMWGITRGKFPFSGILIPGLYLSALLLPFLPISPEHRFPYFYIALGLLYLLVGTVQFFSYLRQHPVAHA